MFNSLVRVMHVLVIHVSYEIFYVLFDVEICYAGFTN